MVIAGKPNAGKSSLLNKLAGDEVAIVTDVPGTTRDVLRRPVHFDGLPVNLIDTAGLRASADVVEAEGVRRARNEIVRADRVLYILDAGIDPDGWAAELEQLPAGIPVTLVYNKIDLIGRRRASRRPPCRREYIMSALTGAGLDLLLDISRIARDTSNPNPGRFAARRRHLDALRRAQQHVRDAADILLTSRAFELFAEDLRLAQHALGEITGEFTSEDLLGEFSAASVSGNSGAGIAARQRKTVKCFACGAAGRSYRCLLTARDGRRLRGLPEWQAWRHL